MLKKILFLFAILSGGVSCFSQELDKFQTSATNRDDTTLLKGDVFYEVEKPPQYPGGEQERVNFLVKTIRYPEQARMKGIEGTVYLTFIVEKSGIISDVRVLRGIGGGCDEEAVRAIRAMPKWKPGTQNGKAVRVQFNMPLKFTLEDKKKRKKK